MVKAVANKFGASILEVEAKDPNITPNTNNSRTKGITRIVIKATAAIITTSTKHTSKVITQINTKAEPKPMVSSNSEDMVMVGPLVTVIIVINTSIMAMIKQ